MSMGKCVMLLLFTAVANLAMGQTKHGWPLKLTDQDHPIANNMGEFWIFGQPYQHPGVDILADPSTASAPSIAVVTVPGEIVWVNDQSDEQFNEVQIKGVDGIRYVYLHFARGTFLAPFADLLWRTQKAATPGMEIGNIYDWGCGFSHLHYELQAKLTESTIEYRNPLADITPNPDDDPPQIEAIHFAKLPRWSEFVPPPVSSATGACTVVKGNVEIVAQLTDKDDADALPTNLDAGNVGTYNLRWRACPRNAPLCTNWNNTHEFAAMPSSWQISGNPETQRQFSTTQNWVSTALQSTRDPGSPGPCPTIVDKAFRVLTSQLAWNATQAGGYPDGSYTVSIEATDFAGNTTISAALACVQNNVSTCTTDLAISDGPNDSGATPYPDTPFWFSPAIKVNPGTPMENTNVVAGSSNVIEVDVRNTGSCPLLVGTPFTVCLGWSPPSGFVPFPLSTGQTIQCKTETVSGSSWLPGQSRKSPFTWTPPSGSLPAGHACLVAWSNMTADPVQATSSVILDNNRAQRNIGFIDAPAPGTMSMQAFWIYKEDALTERSLRLWFESHGSQQYMRAAQLHVPPSVRIGRIQGAEVVGAYRQTRARELCAPGEEARCRSECPNWADEAGRRDCTVVLGGITPESRVSLEDIRVQASAELLLELSTTELVPSGEYVDAHFVESAGSGHQPPTALGGLTLRFTGPARR